MPRGDIETPPAEADLTRRTRLGQYFTPEPIVDAMWSAALARCGRLGLAIDGLRILELAAGDGAFLAGAKRAGIRTEQLLAVEIDPATHGAARRSLGGWFPRIRLGDATSAELEVELLSHAAQGEGVLIIGNPPYNGLSPLLRDAARLGSVQERVLPYLGVRRPRSGFRDDFAFFLGLARRLVHLSGKPGVICLILPRSLLEAFDYAGVREALCRSHRVEVLDVGPGAFADAQVSTAVLCLSPGKGATYGALRWRSPGGGRRGEASRVALDPGPPSWVLRPTRPLGVLLEDTDPITEVLQRWFTPHKTGFDELLVAAQPALLLRRLQALTEALDAPKTWVERFAQEFGPRFAQPRLVAKLEATRRFARGQAGFPEPVRVRPYLRFNPRSARFRAPESQWQSVYFEPRISTLFNHAFGGLVGSFDPHAQKPQLLFNTRESRSYAMVVERPGTLHLYQHTRFAPLDIPEGCWAARGKGQIARQDQGPLRLNLTPAWEQRARRFRRREDLFHFLAALGNSALARRLIAPEIGTQEALPIPRQLPAARAQRVADLARALSAANDQRLERELDREVVALYLRGGDPQPWLDELAELADP